MTVVFDHAAPEDGLSLVVGALEFEPGVVGIDGASGEKVSDFFRADDYVHANGVAAAQGRLHAIERSGDGRNFSSSRCVDFAFRFLAHGKRG